EVPLSRSEDRPAIRPRCGLCRRAARRFVVPSHLRAVLSPHKMRGLGRVDPTNGCTEVLIGVFTRFVMPALALSALVAIGPEPFTEPTPITTRKVVLEKSES